MAAALVAALSAGASVLAAMAATLPREGAIVAQGVGSDDAIDKAAIACPVGWGIVASIGWDHDASRDGHVVTVMAYSSNWWVVLVDTATGAACAIAWRARVMDTDAKGHRPAPLGARRRPRLRAGAKMTGPDGTSSARTQPEHPQTDAHKSLR